MKNNKVESFSKQNDAISFDSNGAPVSFIYDDLWDFSNSEKCGNGKRPVVNFTPIPECYRTGIQYTCAKLYFHQFNAENKAPRSGQIKLWSWALHKIAQLLETVDWTELNSPKSISKFKWQLKSKKWGKRTVENICTTLSKLYEARILETRIPKRQLLRCAKPESTKQHIAIPIDMYSKLLKTSIGIVEKYHPYRHQISETMRDMYRIEDEIQSRFERGEIAQSWFHEKRACLRQEIAHGVPDFKLDGTSKALRDIQTHCLVVVLAFSGIRLGEALSLTHNSYKERVFDDGRIISIIQGEVTKSESGVPRTATWQTHPIVKEAIELAYDMTQALRVEYQKQAKCFLDSKHFTLQHYEMAMREIESVFIKPRRGEHKIYSLTKSASYLSDLPVVLNLKATLADVDEFNLLNPHREGQLEVGGFLPKLTNHDFRRTFAVFFRRYGFGSSTSIKFQYKHRNINMSDYYANNASLQAMEDILMDHDLLSLMDDEGVNLGIDIFDDIYNVSENLSGIGGERIANDKFRKMETGEPVFMTRNEIAALVRNGTLSAVKLPTGGYCLNSSCSRVCSIDTFNAEIKPCEHQVMTDKEAKLLLRQNKRLTTTFRDLNIGDPMMSSILVGIKQKIKRNEISLAKHQIKFDEFNDDISGLIKTEATHG